MNKHLNPYSVLLQSFALSSILGLTFVLNSCHETEITNKAATSHECAIRLDGSIDSLYYNPFIETVDTSFVGWKKVFSNKGRFSIEFPKKRIDMMKENVIKNNKYKMVYVCQLQSFLPVNGNVGYWADYTFYPEKEKDADIQLLFDEHREHLLQFHNSRLVKESNIDSTGYKARELHLVSDAYQLEYTYRLFFHNNILYRIGVTTEASKSGNRFIGRFFKSFEMWE